MAMNEYDPRCKRCTGDTQVHCLKCHEELQDLADWMDPAVTTPDDLIGFCDVLLGVLVKFGLHAPAPRGIRPPPLIVALYEAFEAHHAPMERLAAECLAQTTMFLESIASAKPLGTVEQSEWMIAQAKEGIRRSHPPSGREMP